MLPPDDEGPGRGHLGAPAGARADGRAVLYVHGFADYFFQTDFAQWWLDRGYDFYALDLRKYGRSLLQHQTPNYVTDLQRVLRRPSTPPGTGSPRDEHDHVVVSRALDRRAGGLAVGRPRSPQPWRAGAELAVVRPAGKAWMRTVGTVASTGSAALRRDGSHAGSRLLLRGEPAPRPRRRVGLRPSVKPIDSSPVCVGWLRAIRRGHARLHDGLDVRCPVLVLSSDRPPGHGDGRGRPHEASSSTSSRSGAGRPRIGNHVTYAAVPGARHDVVLSRPAVRDTVYDELERWVTARTSTTVPEPSETHCCDRRRLPPR